MPNYAKVIPQKVRSLLGKLSSRKKAPAPPRLGGVGHRGIAAGSVSEREERNRAFLAGETTEQPWSEEEVSKWENLSPNIVDRFLFNQEVLYVHSTNVEACQFLPDERELIVSYLGDGKYAYSNVSPEEALSFAQAQSKGAWIWSNLRVRGSKTAHRKAFRRVSHWRRFVGQKY